MTEHDDYHSSPQVFDQSLPQVEIILRKDFQLVIVSEHLQNLRKQHALGEPLRRKKGEKVARLSLTSDEILAMKLKRAADKTPRGDKYSEDGREYRHRG